MYVCIYLSIYLSRFSDVLPQLIGAEFPVLTEEASLSLVLGAFCLTAALRLFESTFPPLSLFLPPLGRPTAAMNKPVTRRDMSNNSCASARLVTSPGHIMRSLICLIYFSSTYRSAALGAFTTPTALSPTVVNGRSRRNSLVRAIFRLGREEGGNNKVRKASKNLFLLHRLTERGQD